MRDCERWSRSHRCQAGARLACERAAKAVLAGRAIPLQPTPAQVYGGLSPKLYRELLPLIFSSLEKALRELQADLYPILDRYAPGAVC